MPLGGGEAMLECEHKMARSKLVPDRSEASKMIGVWFT